MSFRWCCSGLLKCKFSYKGTHSGRKRKKKVSRHIKASKKICQKINKKNKDSKRSFALPLLRPSFWKMGEVYIPTFYGRRQPFGGMLTFHWTRGSLLLNLMFIKFLLFHRTFPGLHLVISSHLILPHLISFLLLLNCTKWYQNDTNRKVSRFYFYDISLITVWNFTLIYLSHWTDKVYPERGVQRTCALDQNKEKMEGNRLVFNRD